jgi:polysaccharide deacetylase family protein (PEP-CTERM system associated)
MVSAFENVVSRTEWDRYEPRIENNTYRLLEILDSVQTTQKYETPSTQNAEGDTHNGVSATFFCLGWIAARYPNLIREIQSRGHEIASHGYDHQMITSMRPEEFREDIRKSKAILEDVTGQEVLGYRAPSYSITLRTLWALEIISEEGFFYDSSIFPAHHDRYGIPNAPRRPFYVECNGSDICSQFANPRYLDGNRKSRMSTREGLKEEGRSVTPHALCLTPTRTLIEFPLPTLRIFGQNLPAAGGGYLRLFPIRFTQWALQRIQRENGLPFILYIHPWEIDPDQPRVYGISRRSRFRHYLNLDKTESRLKNLLQEMPFSSLQKLFEGHPCLRSRHFSICS